MYTGHMHRRRRSGFPHSSTAVDLLGQHSGVVVLFRGMRFSQCAVSRYIVARATTALRKTRSPDGGATQNN